MKLHGSENSRIISSRSQLKSDWSIHNAGINSYSELLCKAESCTLELRRTDSNDLHRDIQNTEPYGTSLYEQSYHPQSFKLFD